MSADELFESLKGAASPDDFLAVLFRCLRARLSEHEPFSSAVEVENAAAWVAAVSAICGRALGYCHTMEFSSQQTACFMHAVLESVLASAQLVNATKGRTH